MPMTATVPSVARDSGSSTGSDDASLTAFKQRTHAQIKAGLEPQVRRAKQDLLEKMKQARDDKARQQQLLKEYNETIWAIDQAGTEEFKEEMLREKIRRSADGAAVAWGDLGGDRMHSRLGGFVGDAEEWDVHAATGQRPSSTMGHVRGKSSLGKASASLLSGNRPGTSTGMYGNGGRSSTGSRPSHPFTTPASAAQEDIKSMGIDEARIRKFAEEQARLERTKTPSTPASEESALLRKFAEEQARLHRARSPELARSDTPSKERLGADRVSPDMTRTRKISLGAPHPHTHSPSTSPVDSRLAAFAEQQRQLAQETARGSSGSRLGHTHNSPAQTQRGKPASPASASAAQMFSTNARRASVSASTSTSAAQSQTQTQTQQNMFGRFPLNERDDSSALTKVEAVFVDLDATGTVLNWLGTVSGELRKMGTKYFPEVDGVDWEGFAMKWREMHLAALRSLAEQGNSLAPTTVYRTTLDQLLSKESSELAVRWTPAVRTQLVDVWTQLQPWPDTRDGLQSIKTIKTVATLSNESLRTQTQMSKHARLSWDLCLSTSLLGAYKGTPDAYHQAAHHMTLPPASCALVSAAIDELRVAASAGFKTIYMRRASEEKLRHRSSGVNGSLKGMSAKEVEVRSKLEGGDVDLVVDSFEHLAIVLGCD